MCTEEKELLLTAHPLVAHSAALLLCKYPGFGLTHWHAWLVENHDDFNEPYYKVRNMRLYETLPVVKAVFKASCAKRGWELPELASLFWEDTQEAFAKVLADHPEVMLLQDYKCEGGKWSMTLVEAGKSFKDLSDADKAKQAGTSGSQSSGTSTALAAGASKPKGSGVAALHEVAARDAEFASLQALLEKSEARVKKLELELAASVQLSEEWAMSVVSPPPAHGYAPTPTSPPLAHGYPNDSTGMTASEEMYRRRGAEGSPNKERLDLEEKLTKLTNSFKNTDIGGVEYLHNVMYAMAESPSVFDFTTPEMLNQVKVMAKELQQAELQQPELKQTELKPTED
ncbi:hypothetical protein FOA52_011983 [Chlamydomonas sp. UWO 241]|nr:hypothetical protein FOA52_011983 [Chlamydomonas sp. UWO 241]